MVKENIQIKMEMSMKVIGRTTGSLASVSSITRIKDPTTDTGATERRKERVSLPTPTRIFTPDSGQMDTRKEKELLFSSRLE